MVSLQRFRGPKMYATMRLPKRPWCASTSCSSATAKFSSATSGPRISAWKSAIPQLFPTNVRPETLAKDAAIKQQAAEGKTPTAQFLRFTSPERTPYPENDLVNARWYPAPEHKDPRRPRQAIIVMPQWNADAFSHNSLCTIFNRMGISALRLSKPYHDIRRPG